jgi:adenosylcobalamin phosphodiesterase
MENRSGLYPALNRSHKGKYPFRLGTTSFIYPDHYVPNVKMLGPYLDEIELLLFESLPAEALPSKSVIAELARLAGTYDLTYNIHLPTDVSLSDRQRETQQLAIDTLINVIELCAPLSPSAYTLHIPFKEKSSGNDRVKKWQNRVFDNLRKILPHAPSPKRIAVETLDYSFDLLAAVIDDLDLGVCLDLGHLMARGDDIKTVFKTYSSKTSIIHLHGFTEDRDHQALDQLPAESISSVMWILQRFNGTVSLEVFSFDDLEASLHILDMARPIAMLKKQSAAT